MNSALTGAKLGKWVEIVLMEEHVSQKISVPVLWRGKI
jgi:hypothetical protein